MWERGFVVRSGSALGPERCTSEIRNQEGDRAMRPLRVALCAGALLLAGAAPLQAAWCNVFQVSCSSCGSPAVSYYAPAVSYAAPDPGGCCNPCQTCTTHYEQRCYYQPVTTYQSR